MMISFAQNEAHLADQLAQIAKKKHYTKSGWIKEQIRQEYKNLDLVGVWIMKTFLIDYYPSKKDTEYNTTEIEARSYDIACEKLYSMHGDVEIKDIFCEED